MKKTPLLATLAACVLAAAPASAQLILDDIGTVVVDFDNTLSGVNNGTLNASGNAGYSPTPAVGQLDSDAFAVNITNTALPSDGSGGANTVGFGGSYSGGGNAMRQTTINSGNTGSANNGLNPTTLAGSTGLLTFGSTQLNPGRLFLKTVNNTGSTLSGMDFTFDMWDSGIGNTRVLIEVLYSLDDGMNFTSIASTADYTPGVVVAPLPVPVFSFTDSVSDGSEVIWAMSFSRVGGGSAGQVVFDNLAVTAIPEPATGAMLVGGLALTALLRRRMR